eukprot:jgi/Bigna1/66564/fgenesh1_pg.1_\
MGIGICRWTDAAEERNFRGHPNAMFDMGAAANMLAQLHRRIPNVTYRYGTAGFRADAKILDSVMLRMGMMAALLARLRPGKAIGIMVTASHNKEVDNGIKIADFDGGMLNPIWEEQASLIANCEEEKLMDMLKDVKNRFGIDMETEAVVFIGEDTRKSSPRLAGLAADGALALGAKVKRYEKVTTPQLHWAVWRFNVQERMDDIPGYLSEISTSFLELCKEEGKKKPSSGIVPKLRVDCANGVGAVALKNLAPLFKRALEIEAFNVDTDSKGKLNESCGAEHVQKSRQLPQGIDVSSSSSSSSFEGIPHCSLDGDADRIVFFLPEAKHANKMRLLDGDKIAALVTEVLRELFNVSGLLKGKGGDEELLLRVGVVQTAYANGASTTYLEQQLGKGSVLCAKTGVKHLHRVAHEQLDVGVYFEANGHGTVLFSKKALNALEAAKPASGTPAAIAVQRLRNFVLLINQAVGDALADMLVVVAALRLKGWTLLDWDSIYQDFRVRDRTLVETTDAERKCVSPPSLQPAIDKLVAAAGKNARAFVRPSGTEDVVRIYAEAASQKGADELANKIKAEVARILA